MELLRQDFTFQESVSNSDIQDFSNLFTSYQSYSNFINLNHPQYLEQYNQALADLSLLDIDIVHSLEIPSHLGNELAAVIVILNDFFNI